jgi:hypothetical protein
VGSGERFRFFTATQSIETVSRSLIAEAFGESLPRIKKLRGLLAKLDPASTERIVTPYPPPRPSIELRADCKMVLARAGCLNAGGLQGARMPLLTLGQAIARKIRLIAWCKACLHRFEPDMTRLAAQHGAAITVMTWTRRLRCSQCGARDADFVVAGGDRWT